MKLYFKLENTPQKIKVWQSLKEWVSILVNQSKVCYITISHDEPRSIAQNNFTHPLIRIIAEHAGMTEAMCRDALLFKGGFLKDIVDVKTGEVIKQSVKGLSELTKKENTEFIDFLITFCNENNLIIPERINTGYDVH